VTRHSIQKESQEGLISEKPPWGQLELKMNLRILLVNPGIAGAPPQSKLEVAWELYLVVEEMWLITGRG
jgi:hypothetical protein